MSSFPEYHTCDAVKLAGLIRKGEVLAAEVLEAAIERLEEINPRLNAVNYKAYDRARRAVTAARGPFAGVPFLMKDTNDWVGAPTGWASKLYQNLIAEAPMSSAGRM
jgi:amidase